MPRVRPCETTLDGGNTKTDACPLAGEKGRKAAAIALAVIVALQAVLCIGAIATKQGLFQDESYTLFLTNGEFLYDLPADGQVYHDGEPYESWVTVPTFLGADYGQVIQNQINDVHPPLHYILLAALYSLFPGSWDPAIGLSLNAAAMCIVTVLSFFTARFLGAPRWMALAVAAVWAVSPAMVNDTVYLRMYGLLTLWFAAAAALAARIASRRSCSVGEAVALFLVTACGGLTQYFFLPYAFVLYLCVGIVLLLHREIAAGVRFAIGSIAGALSVFLLFPAAFDHIFSGYRGVEALSRAADGSSFVDFFVRDWRQLDTGNTGGVLILIAIVLIAAAAVSFLMRRKNADAKASSGMCGWMSVGAYVSLAVAAVAFVTIIARVAPYPSIRYVLSVQPVLQMCVFLPLAGLCLWLAKNRARQALVAFAVVAVLITGLGYSHGIKYWDQENDDVAALAQENATFMGVWENPMMVEAFLPDATDYDTGVYFSSPESLGAFDFSQVDGGVTLIVQDGVDFAPYKEAFEAAAPGVRMTYVGDTIDHFDVYDVEL